MKSNGLMHERTARQVSNYLLKPSQVVALIGPDGVGKASLARSLAGNLLGLSTNQVEANANLQIISKLPDKQEISIEQARQLISKLKTKSSDKRITIIEGAGQMSLEAQNALLKLLEQPGPNDYFVLTIDSKNQILPTVLSRASTITVQPVGLDSALTHYSSAFADEDIKAAWNISGGLTRLLDEILTGKTEVKASIEVAKSFLRQDKYQRLITVDGLSKDRLKSAEFLESLDKVIRALHHSSIRRQNTSVDKLLEARKLTSSAQQALADNSSVKLTLLNLVTSLKI